MNSRFRVLKSILGLLLSPLNQQAVLSLGIHSLSSNSSLQPRPLEMHHPWGKANNNHRPSDRSRRINKILNRQPEAEACLDNLPNSSSNRNNRLGVYSASLRSNCSSLLGGYLANLRSNSSLREVYSVNPLSNSSLLGVSLASHLNSSLPEVCSVRILKLNNNNLQEVCSASPPSNNSNRMQREEVYLARQLHNSLNRMCLLGLAEIHRDNSSKEGCLEEEPQMPSSLNPLYKLVEALAQQAAIRYLEIEPSPSSSNNNSTLLKMFCFLFVHLFAH